MPDQVKVQKAKIYKLSQSGAVDSSKVVVAHFNPKELQISGRIEWVKQKRIGKDVPKMTFSGGDAQDLTIELLFDSTDTGEDVRQSYRTLLQIAAVDVQKKNNKTRKSEPASCQFQWGKLLSFNAVIKSISQTFTMFKPDGTPLRAKVKVTFAQIGEAPRSQNPTSRTEPRKVWVVHEGDRLDWIAYQEYGDATHWRHIAEANNLADPIHLQVGQVLNLTPLP